MKIVYKCAFFFFSSRRRHTRSLRDWSSDVCSSDLFERVKCCKCRSVNPAGKDAVLNLLAVKFSQTDPPAGVVNLIFSGGGMLRLEVECLEVELADLGPSWPATARPVHVDEAPDARG